MHSESSPQVDVKEFLRSLLSGLAEEELDEVAQAAEVLHFPAGADICRDGELGDTVYYIVQGRVEILKHLDEETDYHINDLGPGDHFGEIAILQEGPRTATVRASEPTTVLEIGDQPFLTVLGHSPSLGVRILVDMTARLRDADQQSIIELRQANVQLTRALRRLERLDRTKTDFIQVSAHELRTPVATLSGYAQMMRSNRVIQENPELQALVKGMVGATERLHRIFNSILDLSRLMTGGLEVTLSPVSIPVVFEGIYGELEGALKERDLTFETAGLDDLPLYSGEPDLIYKLFSHLVNNAVKYTPDGGRITVTGRTVEQPDLGRCIELSIEDTGIGIASDDLDLVFEKFYRTDEPALHSSGKTKFKGGGPGLGLAIARGIVVAHGGHIWAESPGYDEEGCPGARFVVQLPVLGGFEGDWESRPPAR